MTALETLHSLLTIAEAATLVRRSPSWLRAKIHAGELAPYARTSPRGAYLLGKQVEWHIEGPMGRIKPRSGVRARQSKTG